MPDWNVVVLEPVQAMLRRILEYIPKLVGVAIIFIVGWIIAKVAQGVVVQFLKWLRLDSFADRVKLSDFLAKGEIRYSPTELIGVLVYWLLMLVVVVASLNALNLTVVGDLLNQVVLYIPLVLAAIFIVILGVFLASFSNTVVRTAAANAGVRTARTMGELVQTVVVIFAVVLALDQLRIGEQILRITIAAILGSIGLGFAIAFGLGCKDQAAKWVERAVDRFSPKHR